MTESATRLLRVYVSSTLADACDEREFLAAHVFPELREFAKNRGISLVPVDLRHGILQEYGDDMLRLALTEIEGCAPFFVGILGERYGWRPSGFPADLASRHPWLKGCLGQSCLEVEFSHILNNTQAAPWIPLFCFRDPQVLCTMPPFVVAQFQETNAERRYRLSCLKKKIRVSGASLVEYGCSWDPVAGRIRDLEAFGQMVSEHLRTQIEHISPGDSLYSGAPPPSVPLGASTKGPLPALAARLRHGSDALASRESLRGDPVTCTVYAPPEAKPGDSVLVQIHVHTSEAAQEVDVLAREFDTTSGRRGVTSLETSVAQGTILAFELGVKRASVVEPLQELLWTGLQNSVQFEVEIPGDTRPCSLIMKILVSQQDVPTGRILSRLGVVPSCSYATAAPEPSGAGVRHRTAFVSYASQDRVEVMKRVQMLRAVGISCFQDVMDLDPGDRWAKELFHHIDESDVLFLFWSSSAKASEWVQREWEYGLERHGDDFVLPVIIEGPPIPEPPERLKHLHFSDKVLYFIRGMQQTGEQQNPPDEG